MKYIRTKDAIFKVTSKAGNIYCAENQNNEFVLVNGRVVVKEADTIEELMMIDDLVFKKNKDIFVIKNQAYIDYYIKHKSVAKLFIKDSKGNYIRVAEENDKGELELL